MSLYNGKYIGANNIWNIIDNSNANINKPNTNNIVGSNDNNNNNEHTELSRNSINKNENYNEESKNYNIIKGGYGECIYGGLPTMMLKGNLKQTDLKYTQEYLDSIKPVDHIINLIKDKKKQPPNNLSDRVFILKAETGSGKSTGFVVSVYDEISSKEYPNKYVICTQPKVLTAQSNVDSILDWNKKLKRGEDIGYITGKSKWKPRRGVLFSTVGTLSAQLENWEDKDIIEEYSFILIDEVHERSEELDVAIYLLKEFLLRNIKNKDLPFVFLMSATFDYTDHMKYFDLTLENVIEVGGIAYDRKTIWPKFTTRDYIKESIQLAYKIHKENKDDPLNFNDILIFMTGPSDINKAIRELNNLKDEGILPLALYGDVVGKEGPGFMFIEWPIEKVRVYLKKPKIIRRIYVANVVAETGLTIGTLKYCIDCGLIQNVNYDPIKNTTLIYRGPNTQSGLLQRKGRIGRKFDGIYYPMFTESDFNKLIKITYPSIYDSNISTTLLKLMFIKTNVSMEIPALLSYLPTDSVNKSLQLFKSLGYYKSDLGRIASELCKCQISVEASKIILSSYIYGISTSDAIELAIVATIKKSKYVLPDIKDHKFCIDAIIDYLVPRIFLDGISTYMFRIIIGSNFIESLFLLNAFKKKLMEDYMTIPKLKEWCSKMRINFGGILELLKIRDDLLHKLVSLGFIIETQSFIIDKFEKKEFNPYLIKMKRCVYEGFKNNLAYYNKEDSYYYTKENLKIRVPQMYTTERYHMLKQNGVELLEKPQVIMYNSLSSGLDFKNKSEFRTQAEKLSILDGIIQVERPTF